MCVVWLGGASVQAAIVTTGNVQPPYPVTNPDPWIMGGSLYVAYTSDGSLKVNGDSDVIDRNGFIGYWPGATGSVTVTDSGSTWENTGNLSLGRASGGGIGSLEITDYGTVYVGDAASSVISDLFWLYISDADSSGTSGGHVYIYSGSTLTNDGNTMMGVWSGEYGWVTVDGAGASWTNGALAVGNMGTGTLSVQNGGSVSSWWGQLGYGDGGTGTVTVDGTNSSWTNSSSLSVANGTLTIQNGGSVSCDDGQVWHYGDVMVTGPGSTWENTGDLSLDGNSLSGAHGMLTISNGGTVFVGEAARNGGTAGWLTVSDVPGSYGGLLDIFYGTLNHYGSAIVGDDLGELGRAWVVGAGSSWTNGGDLLVGFRGSGHLEVEQGGSVINGESLTVGLYGSGTFLIERGGSLSNTDGWLGYHSNATGTATVDGIGSTWESTGNLSLGRSSDSGVGSLTISDGGTVYVGDAARSGGWDDILIVSDADASGTAGGHLFVHNGSTLHHGSHAMLGEGGGEYGWATVDGANSSWTNDGSLFIGYSGAGTLTVENGGSVSNIGGFIGYSGPGATGVVTVAGSGSTWESTGNLTLGRSFSSGVGALTVTDGGTVLVGDAARSGGRHDCLVVSDVDTSGSAGGHLHLYHGSTINHGSFAIVGDDVSEHGWATVEGFGSAWTNSESLVVGYSGTGTLTVQDGGSVSNADGWIGFNTGSTGTVTIDGPTSSWTNDGPLAVGFEGSGALHVQNDGSVSATGDGLIGYWTGADGTVTVQGTGSSWTNGGGLYIGTLGSGTFTIQNGGQVTTANVEMGRAGAGPDTGTLVVDDGTLDVTGSMLIDQTGWVDFSDGMIRAHTIDDPYGNFNWNGGTLVIGTFQGDLGNPSGDLVPGVSPGLARVTGDYVQGGDALLEIEIDGPVPAVGYDQLRVGGNVQIDGTLDLLVSDALPLDVGETFVLIDALGDVTGKFAWIGGVVQSDTRAFAVTYDSHEVRVRTSN